MPDVPAQGTEYDHCQRLFDNYILDGVVPNVKNVNSTKIFDPMLNEMSAKSVQSLIKRLIIDSG